MTGVPGRANSRPFISSILRRSFCSSGASRRRMPTLTRICGIGGVGAVHVVALLVGDHLEGQLVVVAQEDAPTGSRRAGRASAARMSTTGKRSSMRSAMNSRGMSGKWKAHVALVAVAEVGDAVLGPLVGLGQQHAARDSRSSTCARSSLRKAWVSGRFSQLVPSRSNRYGMASRRRPSTPRSSQ